MRMFFLLWVLGIFINLISLYIHDLLVTKYQPEQKKNSKKYKRESLIAVLWAVIPIFNFVLFFKILHNIVTYDFPEEGKSAEE